MFEYEACPMGEIDYVIHWEFAFAQCLLKKTKVRMPIEKLKETKPFFKRLMLLFTQQIFQHGICHRVKLPYYLLDEG